MQQVLQRLPSGARVCVIRLRSLGDCVLTTPALSLLKSYRPDLEIAIVAEERFFSVFEDNPAISAILPPSKLAVARWRSDLCINLHGGTRSMLLTVASGAKLRAGFAHFNLGSFCNIRIPTAQEILGIDRKVHTAEHLASAMFYLGVPMREIPRASLYAPRIDRPRPYAIIHPFASAPGKAWPAGHFVAIAQQLEPALEPIFIAGPGDDATPFRNYTTLANLPLRQVKSHLQSASMFIGNDSGPAHMAAAFGIPCLVLFGTSDPVIWAPWKTESAVITGGEGIGSIEIAQVAQAAGRLAVPR